VTGADEGADEVATEVDEGFGGGADDKDVRHSKTPWIVHR
jgi:hypothetical protein